MRWLYITSAVAACAAALPASAQDGNYRRFTQDLHDTNRSNRIVYVPLAMSSPDRPGEQPHDTAAASWALRLGAQNAKPTTTLEKADYVLERFDTMPASRDGQGRMRVVITRRPGAPEGTALPRLDVVHPDTWITASATPTVERLSDGVRYTFLVTPPRFGRASQTASGVDNTQYSIRFMPARNVPIPQHITQAPTFGGRDVESRMADPGPGLTPRERVAGRRQEIRNGRVMDRRR